MYIPHTSILQRYAKVLVNFALNSGKGINEKEVVRLVASESAKPLYREVRNQIFRSGGIVIGNYLPDDISRENYELLNDWQLDFYPDKYFQGIAEQVDHTINILSDTNLRELEGIPPEKIMRRAKAVKPFRKLLEEKENQGKYSWTLALFGTPAMAAEAKLTEEEYWEQIIKACFLDFEDPIEQWQKVATENANLRKKLDSLQIKKVHIKGDGVDLEILIGNERKWLGGSGRNIPSFEVFISPDWRGTQGSIRFDQPLYRYGTLIEGIELEFDQGRVVKYNAKTNLETLKEMIECENADKIGEFSLTDKRHSRIEKFMANTLFDENISGKYGNTHIALGNAYKESFTGEVSSLNSSEWSDLGFNESIVHTDVVSTTKRTVTAELGDGTSMVIYKDGEFLI